jgi:hypothetical protein
MSGNVRSFGLEDEGGLPDIAELVGRSADPAEAADEIRHQLGIGTRRVRYRDRGLPEVDASEIFGTER